MPRHTEKRFIAHSPEQMFDLVADVEKYPEFLPWCVAARIRQRDGDILIADLMIGFKMVREKFTSKVTLDAAHHRIDVEYTDGPFKYLKNHWIFDPAEGGGTEIDFFVDFEFRNKMLDAIMGKLFGEAVGLMVRAFESRADALYGKD